jgi:hypothetical protein
MISIDIRGFGNRMMAERKVGRKISGSMRSIRKLGIHQLLVRKQQSRSLCIRDRSRGICRIYHRCIWRSIRGSNSRLVSGKGDQLHMILCWGCCHIRYRNGFVQVRIRYRMLDRIHRIRIRILIHGCKPMGRSSIKRLVGMKQLVGIRRGQVVAGMSCSNRAFGRIRIRNLVGIRMGVRARNNRNRMSRWVRSSTFCMICNRMVVGMVVSNSSRGRGSVSGVPGSMGGLALRRRGLGPRLWWGASMLSRLELGRVVCSRRRRRERKGEAL